MKTINPESNHPKSVLMFVSAMLIFGTIGVFRRYLPLPSAFLAFSRGILGGLFLLGFTRLSHRTAGEKLPARTALGLAFTGAVMGINWILLFEAYNYTTVAVATLCYYMQPTIVMLLSPFLFREKVTWKKGICATAAIIGMILVSGVTGGGNVPPGNLRGILLGLGAAACYSVVVIMNKKISGIDAYPKTIIQLLSAGAVMIPYLLLTDGFQFGEFSGQILLLLLIVGLVHTGVAYMLYFGSMDGMKAQSIAILSYIDPVSALLFSALLLREPLGVLSIVGAVMILGSSVFSELQTAKG